MSPIIHFQSIHFLFDIFRGDKILKKMKIAQLSVVKSYVNKALWVSNKRNKVQVMESVILQRKES